MLIVLVALASTMVFAVMIIKDFDNYVSKVRDDQQYWIMASVEGAYQAGRWNPQMLAESMHWAMMMGLDMKVLDAKNNEVVHAHHVMEALSPNMKRRMEELFHVHMHNGAGQRFQEFPIVIHEEKVGTLLARSFPKKALAEKETAFRGRVRYFLYAYLLIAGIGSILIGFVLTQYLSKPVLSLKKASEKIGIGDFSVRRHHDHGMRQRVQHRIGRRIEFGGDRLGPAHAACFHAKSS